jgi:hypothetical protein
MEEQAKAPFWKPALIYGAIVGFVGILLGVIFYFMDLTGKSWLQWVNLLITFVVVAYCLVAYRKEYLGGFASYGQLFVMALVIGVISTILSSIFSYFLFTVIDPDLLDKIRLMAEDKMLSNPRIPESMQDDMIERFARMFTVKRMLIMGFVSGVLFNAIVGLILAAFIKKEDTPQAAAL